MQIAGVRISRSYSILILRVAYLKSCEWVSWEMRNLRIIKFMPSLSTEWWTWLIRAGCGWMRPEKAPEFHDPCRSLGTEGGGVILPPNWALECSFWDQTTLISLSGICAHENILRLVQNTICKFGIWPLLSVSVMLVTGLPQGLINPVRSRNYVDYTGDYCH